MRKMTSMLTDDDRRVTKMKLKSGNQKVLIAGTPTTVVRDETRSFLNFSRENLSISQSELEQGFNRPSRCFRPSKHSILSLVAISVALVCAAIEIWKLHRVISNTRDIEIIKRDIEAIRHRLFGEDFMDELKAFEEQLYADMSGADQDSGEADIESADYDNNYDEDYSPNWSDYVSDSSDPTTATTQSLVVQSSQSSLKNDESKSTFSSISNRERMKMLAVLQKVEAKRKEFEKSIHETRQNIAKERSQKDNRDSSRIEEKQNKEQHDESKENHPKQRRAVTEGTPMEYTNIDEPIFDNSHFREDRNHTRRENNLKHDSDGLRHVRKKKSRISTTETVPWDRYPPKKYFSVTRVDDRNDFPLSSQSKIHRTIPPNQSENLRRFQQTSELTRRSLKPRILTRRHLRASRQVFAAHYGADSTLFGMEDEHTGNGRAKHNEGIFKAWRPSEWVTELGMNKHFTLSRDGRLSVHEPGLYLVYGQIHYLDEHDENGFHILVNGQPILQCMVYSPGTGHKSRSCFSAQITVLQGGDRLVLKDVGPARYTLFQRDKSFFGLVKLGESRQQQHQQQQQQQQQQQSKHTTQEPETLR